MEHTKLNGTTTIATHDPEWKRKQGGYTPLLLLTAVVLLGGAFYAGPPGSRGHTGAGGHKGTTRGGGTRTIVTATFLMRAQEAELMWLYIYGQW